MTFQTTGTNTPAPAAMGFLPAIHAPRGESSGPAGLAQNFVKFFSLNSFAALAILAAILCALFAPAMPRVRLASLDRNSTSSAAVLRLISAATLFVIFAVALSSCGGSSAPKLKRTPAGTTNLMVQGTAQNATRGFTVTLVVN